MAYDGLGGKTHLNTFQRNSTSHAVVQRTYTNEPKEHIIPAETSGTSASLIGKQAGDVEGIIFLTRQPPSTDPPEEHR